jgi:hypothetical protein
MYQSPSRGRPAPSLAHLAGRFVFVMPLIWQLTAALLGSPRRCTWPLQASAAAPAAATCRLDRPGFDLIGRSAPGRSRIRRSRLGSPLSRRQLVPLRGAHPSLDRPRPPCRPVESGSGSGSGSPCRPEESRGPSGGPIFHFLEAAPVRPRPPAASLDRPCLISVAASILCPL